MTAVDIIGWLAAALTLLTFSMRSMVALRVAALAANLSFIAYGLLGGLYPIVVLHAMLLPCNVLRLWQLRASWSSVSWLRACFVVAVGAIAITGDDGRAEEYAGFAEGYAHAARGTCHLQEGPALRSVDYRALSPDANALGMRNFFVAVRIFGKPYACADALSTYGPSGVIRRGLLAK